jgi:hypothetical protein
MLLKTLLSTTLLLLLRSHEVSASDAAYHSFGQISPCQNAHPANVTSFDMSIFPENATLIFNFSGLATIPGNATLSIAVEADGDEVYRAMLDPCSVGIPDLCPASGDAASFANASLNIPADTFDRMNLSSHTDVRGRLSLQTYDQYARFHSSCVETALRSDSSENENGTAVAEGSGAGNETDGGKDSNSTNGRADNDGLGTAQGSGASTLQGVGYVAM